MFPEWNRSKHEWIWSHVARLRISPDIAEISYGSENIVMLNRKEIKYNKLFNKCNAKLASFGIAGIAVASSVFNREHYRRERHLLKIMDPVLGLNTNLCFITSTITAIPIDADPKIDICNP
ncbi:hypothetical protein T4B_4442 [Trichinella pseudospiralis]|uniref:Uncharacterized protein n=2 Tax=Trichinella pseudospiralis TaxID=6337 RepID=A0A0V1GSQ0_TRIPS|nr:hypothetical protein T4B_4442 [Trichinella pseudospiralis]